MSDPQVARVVVVGNPNAGKSTLFNALTGGQARVGNFAGTTVSATRGRWTRMDGSAVELVDVPGTFSLAAARPDERVAIDAVLGLGPHAPPDALLVVADGPRLARSLYLVLQLLELRLPMVLAVNLMDEARAGGLAPDLDALADALGIPVVGTVARRREGIDALKQALEAVLVAPETHVAEPVHGWSAGLDAQVAAVAADLPEALVSGAGEGRRDALARWALLSADEAGRVPGIEAPLPSIVAARDTSGDLHAELVGARYAWIDARTEGFLGHAVAAEAPLTERIDRVALHPWLGSLAFVVVTGLAFSALFAWADPLIGAIESVFGWIGEGVAAGFDGAIASAPGASGLLTVLRDLTVDGVIGGVGGVLVFLPQIALLFLFLAVLEDCGYLARASHLADRVLRSAGLPGGAFVPLLSGYACAVPAILATRTMPRFRDRLLTMMVLPLTSCSARLPVYTLLIAALFPATVWGSVPLRPLALAGMYLFSTLLTLGAAILIGRAWLPAAAESSLIELPPYRLPDPGIVLRQVWSRCVDFMREAGGIILVATVVLWALLYFPRYEPEVLVPPAQVAQLEAAGHSVDDARAQEALRRSYAGRLGLAMEPAIAPLGYDWKIGVGLIGAFAAREVFVSTMGVVYGVGDADEESTPLRTRLLEDRRADGSPLYTPLVGLSIMVFFAIALQCLSTLAVLRKESGSWVWPVATFAWMLALAWGAAFVVYQGGRALGFT